ncbi:MAG: hypothetical protein HZA60_03620 [Deltaproteobacteria bacterium]|nr:hypothetical protein [Deltaproteobacteria bacterium]
MVEAALIAPVLLLLLAGAYVACRTVFLHSAAESGAHAEAIRSGRRLHGIEQRMADSILPGGHGVAIRTDGGKKSRLLPSPFPALAGRTIAIAEIRKEWEEAGGIAVLPALRITRASEMSVDCWGKRSASGKKIRNVFHGIVAAGIFR